MKKLLALLIIGSFVVACSSESPSTDTNLVIVKHKMDASGVSMKKRHHKRKRNASMDAAKMGS